MRPTILTFGRWLPVCSECGACCEPVQVRSRLKIEPYCFKCEKFTIKFEKMEEIGDLAFNQNWNGKLNCNCFTTIRLANRTKYFPGARKRVVLKGQPRGMATVLQVKSFLLNELNEFTARIDTGLSMQDCKQVIRIMYKNSPVNWDNQPLCLVLLQYDKDKDAPKLEM